MGIFKKISKFIDNLTGETKRQEAYKVKQREATAPVQQEHHKLTIKELQKAYTFWKKTGKRRAKELMRLNSNRKARGLFQYD